MIVLSNTSEQIVPAGQALTFNTVLFDNNCSECCGGIRNNSINLKRKGPHKIEFHANVATNVSARQLVFQVDGVQLPETQITTPLIAEGSTVNVSAATVVSNCCGCVPFTVINNGAVPVTVRANPVLIIERVCCG